MEALPDSTAAVISALVTGVFEFTRHTLSRGQQKVEAHWKPNAQGPPIGSNGDGVHEEGQVGQAPNPGTQTPPGATVVVVATLQLLKSASVGAPLKSVSLQIT